MSLDKEKLDSFLSNEPKDVIKSIHDNLNEWHQLLVEAADASTSTPKTCASTLIKIVKVVGSKVSSLQDSELGQNNISNNETYHLKQQQIKILTVTCSNDKFMNAVKNTVVKLSLKTSKNDCLKQVVSSLHSFCNELLDTLPLLAKDVLPSLICACIGVIAGTPTIDWSNSLDQFTKLQGRIEEISNTFAEKQSCGNEFDNNLEMLLDASEPPEDFRTIPIIPSLYELLTERNPFLRPNKVRGAYKNADHYLDVQFRLLREDFVQPLRKAVEKFMRKRDDYIHKKHNRQEDPGVRVYTGIKFKTTQVTKPDSPLSYIFTLPSTLTKSINWNKSKKLLPGSLVMLTPDYCRTAIFAVTLEPPYQPRKDQTRGKHDSRRREVAEGILRLTIETGSECVDKKSNYIMLECEAYFEAYKHNLKALQNLTFLNGNDESTPIAKYIVDGGNQVKAPSYIGTCETKNIVIKKRGQSGQRILEAPAHEPEKWDSDLIKKATGLDPDQYVAYRTALTSELSVIQGPPGTGKTHVGLQIVKTLLLNKPGSYLDTCVEDVNETDDDVPVKKPKLSHFETPNSPILVLCYTNHALDQFLEHLLHNIDGLSVVRVGGQVKCESMKDLTLQQHRRRVQTGRQKLHFERYCTDVSEQGEELKRATSTVFGLEAKLNSVGNEIAELRKPSGVFEFSVLWVGRRLERLIPSILWDTLSPEWLGIYPRVFGCSDFNLEELVSTFFTVKGRKRKLDDKSRGKPEIGSGNSDSRIRSTKPDVNEKATQHDEDYDMDELLEHRVQDEYYDHDHSWVGDSKKPHPRVYFKDLSIVTCNAGYDWIKTHRKQYHEAMTQEELLVVEENEIRAKEYSNLARFFTRVFTLRLEDRLELPDLSSVFYKREGEDAWTFSFRKAISCSMRSRWGIYFKILEIALGLSVEMEKELGIELEVAKKRLVSEQEKLDGCILKDADVVGFTTTGAAKNRGLLEFVKPGIVVVEEAAEILESHVITSLTGHCKQLILIGDHFQLRPKTNVYALETKYRMNVSLFERMILNGVDLCTLKTQHRMRPQISNLITGTIYEDLKDHEKVFDYPKVMGVKESVFFVTHNELEETDPEISSKRNRYEATFLIGLCDYLLKQGYDADKITILTMYTGQMFLLKKLLPLSCAGVRVTCVDNYQGEENVIILLSLVRSNDNGDLGFVGRDNRICVALSRAQHGLYVVGNMNCLGRRNGTWHKISGKLRSGGSIGDALEVVCDRHGNVSRVGRGSGFDKLVAGGCGQICNGKLACGHACKSMCHAMDQDHKNYNCKTKCDKVCEYNHECKLLCFEACKKCTNPIARDLQCGHTVILPCHIDYLTVEFKSQQNTGTLTCGHTRTLPCYKSPESVKCHHVMIKPLPCGHDKKLECHEDETLVRCSVLVEKFLPCSHVAMVKCHVPVSLVKCKVEKDNTLPCGHVKKLECHVSLHGVKCDEIVNKTLPCGHDKKVHCHASLYDLRCFVFVNHAFVGCSHKQRLSCHLTNKAKCPEKCDKILKCGHHCPSYCHATDDPNHEYFKCNRPCKRSCDHKHPCQLRHQCHLNCLPCKVAVRVKLDCGHKMRVPCNQQGGDVKCTVKIEKKLPCGHTQSVSCHVRPEDHDCTVMVKCSKSCGKGHGCVGHACYEDCPPCGFKTPKLLGCNHYAMVGCFVEGVETRCREMVEKTLSCLHKCHVECYKDLDTVECKVRVEITCSYCRRMVTATCGSRDPLGRCDYCVRVVERRDEHDWRRSDRWKRDRSRRRGYYRFQN